MATSVRVTLNEQAFRRMNEPGGLINQAVARAAGKVRDQAVTIITAEGQVDTGALRQSIMSEQVTTSTGGVYYRVGSRLFYAILQHEGVPGPIYPRRAKVLRFTPKGSSVFIFRPRVAGFPGTKYLTRALATLTASDFRG